METCPCSNSSPVLILGEITDNASEGPTVTQRGALVLSCTSLGQVWGNTLLCWLCSPFGSWRLGAEVEAQQEDPILLISKLILFFLAVLILLLFQSFQMGAYGDISLSVLKRQHTCKTNTYMVKTFVFLFHSVPWCYLDSAVPSPSSLPLQLGTGQ